MKSQAATLDNFLTDLAGLRDDGCSWREIAEKVGVAATTARRALYALAKSPAETPAT